MSILTIFVVAIAAILLTVVVATITSFNSIVEKKNAVLRAWADVIVYERQKGKVVTMVEELLREHNEFESNTYKQIVSLRGALNNLSDSSIKVQDHDALKQFEEHSKKVKQSLMLTVEDYPVLKASLLFNSVMDEIADQEENVSASIQIYNQNIENFNTGIQVFPNSFVNSVFNKEKEYVVFTDDKVKLNFKHSPMQVS